MGILVVICYLVMTSSIIRGLFYTAALYAIHSLTGPMEKRIVEKKPYAEIQLFGAYWLGMSLADWLISRSA